MEGQKRGNVGGDTREENPRRPASSGVSGGRKKSPKRVRAFVFGGSLKYEACRRTTRGRGYATARDVRLALAVLRVALGSFPKCSITTGGRFGNWATSSSLPPMLST